MNEKNQTGHTDIKTKLSLKKYFLWPSIAGFLFGLLSIAGLFLDTASSPALKFYVYILTIVPLLPFIAIVQPILQLEGEQTLLYVIASPLFWGLIGLFVGFIAYRLRLATLNRAEYFETTDSRERAFDRLRISLVIALAVILGTAIFLSYRDTMRLMRVNEEITKKITQAESQKRQERINKQLAKIISESGNDEQNSQDQPPDAGTNTELNTRQQEEILAGLKWKHYYNPTYGIQFDYPENWILTEPEIGKEELYVKIAKPGESDSDDEMMPDPLNVRVLGIEHGFIPDHPNNIVGSCAYEYDSLDQFCEEGCERISDIGAIDFRFVNHGEPIFSALGYYLPGKPYPETCLEMVIDQLMIKTGTQSEELKLENISKIDFQKPKNSVSLDPEIFEALAIFRHMAESIEYIQ